MMNKESVSEAVIDKLLQSFNKLDTCIEVTKDVLSSRDGVPENVVSRINQYTDIVSRQRELTFEMKGYISTGNWEEVSRHVKLINALSSMIRDDAQAILSGQYGEEEAPKKDDLVC